MLSPDPFLLFTRTLNRLGIRYMVTGSIAAIFYGEPRLTNDVDIVIVLRRDDVRLLTGAFPPDEFYCPPPEVIESERLREQRGHFNLIHHETGFKADIYPAGREALHVWALTRAVEASIEGEKVTFAPPEYVIVRKLQYFREGGSPKHLRDISRMLLGLGEDWDRTPLESLIKDHGLTTEWALVSSFEN